MARNVFERVTARVGLAPTMRDVAHAKRREAAGRERKYHLKGNFVRERLHDPAALRRAGFTVFRTKVQGAHRLILALPAGRRAKGQAVVQAILHPRSEIGTKFLCGDTMCRRINR